MSVQRECTSGCIYTRHTNSATLELIASQSNCFTCLYAFSPRLRQRSLLESNAFIPETHSPRSSGLYNKAVWPFFKKPISFWPLGVERESIRADSLEDHRKWLTENYVKFSVSSFCGIVFALSVVSGVTANYFKMTYNSGVLILTLLVLVLFIYSRLYDLFIKNSQK